MGLFKVILNVAHFIIALRTAVFNVLGLAIKTLHSFSHKQTLSKIRNDSRCLKKLPLHIGLVFVEENISFLDVVNMLVWSMAMGITYISLYDRFGNVKRSKDILQSKFTTHGTKILGDDCKKYDVQVHTSSFKKRPEGGCNGHQRVDVTLLSIEDGKQNLVSLSKNFACSVASGNCKLEDITPSAVDSMLIDEHGFPDPDLVLCFGPSHTLMGFLPWQVRLTEILRLPTHHSIHYKDFYRAITSYGNTQQRFGK